MFRWIRRLAAAAALLMALPALAQITQITWTQVAPQANPVSEATGRVLNDKLYVFGGFRYPDWNQPTNRAQVYDPLTNTWTALAPLPHNPKGAGFGGANHIGIATDGTDFYLASGYVSNSSGTAMVYGSAEVWKYVVAENRYERMPDLPEPVAGGQMEHLNGRLHYFGATNQPRTADLAVHWVLDLATPGAGWVASTPLPFGRHHMGSIVYKGKIYTMGGQIAHNVASTTKREFYVFDPATEIWTRLADVKVDANAGGLSHISSAVVLVNDEFYVFGGQYTHWWNSAQAVAYSPATNTWRSLNNLPLTRYSGVAGYINGKFYYTGGSQSAATYVGTPASKSLAFSPTTITVNAAAGAAQQTVQSRLTASTGTPVPSLSVSPGSTWLKLPAAALGTLNFGVNPAGLAPGTYAATVTAAAGGYGSATLGVMLNVNPPSTPAAQRFNAGATTAFVTADNRRFAQDTYFTGTNRVFSIASGDILNTVDDTLYRSQRSAANFGYAIPVANGSMTVTLHFAEIWWGAPGGGVGGAGKRLFNVDIEGARKLTNFDVFAAAGGAMRATQRSFVVNVTDGVLNINFSQGAADMPEVSAIEVVPN